MNLFKTTYLVEPPWPFGLPDDGKTVIPAAAGRSMISPVINSQTGLLVAHGTLSEYRSAESQLAMQMSIGQEGLTVRDNFFTFELLAADSQQAVHRTTQIVERVCQILSVQFGFRFLATALQMEDHAGELIQIPKTREVSLGYFGLYNISELKGRVETAFDWSTRVTKRAEKSLLYFEHACILREFSQSIYRDSPHNGLSKALSFLQLFKALSVIIGEKGTDRDFQRRFRVLGLPKDFISVRVDPLYHIRNDDDVAHYRTELPNERGFADNFANAVLVFRDALGALMAQANLSREDV